LNIIIAMAGEGSRFKSAGFSMPKHDILVRGRTLFEWSVLSLQNFFSEKFYFVGRKGNWDTARLKDSCQRMGLIQPNFIELADQTKGQADTVNQALARIEAPNEPLIIYNIDTYVEPEVILPSDIKGDGWIPVFEAQGDRWSFCVVSPQGRVLEVAEKKRISNLATVGLYYFSSGLTFAKCYSNYTFSKYPEQFVAPLYDSLLNDGSSQVFATTLPASAVHVLGTPEDVRQFAPEFG
jgi:dTDP-glucose pyrophosphorylase